MHLLEATHAPLYLWSLGRIIRSTIQSAARSSTLPRRPTGSESAVPHSHLSAAGLGIHRPSLFPKWNFDFKLVLSRLSTAWPVNRKVNVRRGCLAFDLTEDKIKPSSSIS